MIAVRAGASSAPAKNKQTMNCVPNSKPTSTAHSTWYGKHCRYYGIKKALNLLILRVPVSTHNPFSLHSLPMPLLSILLTANVSAPPNTLPVSPLNTRPSLLFTPFPHSLPPPHFVATSLTYSRNNGSSGSRSLLRYEMGYRRTNGEYIAGIRRLRM